MNTTPYPMSTVPFAKELIETAVKSAFFCFFPGVFSAH